MEDFKCRTFAVKDGLLITRQGGIYSLNYYGNGKIHRLKYQYNNKKYPYISIKGRKTLVHRIIAECFVPNPHNLPEIDHINRNPLDCRASNLRWTSHKGNMNNPLTRERMSEVHKNQAPQSRKVYQYTLDGKFVKEWPSLGEVERTLGYRIGVIGAVCRGDKHYKIGYGYQWRYEKADSLPSVSYSSKKVYRYTTDGVFLDEWESTGEAAKRTGVHQTAISSVCIGKRKSAGNYLWSYEKKECMPPLSPRGESQKNHEKFSKTVYQYTSDLELVEVWPSTKEIERRLGFRNTNVSACCLGKLKTYHGFIWSYSPLS